MKQMAVFLSGVTATLTGVFIRSCEPGIEIDLANAWCGKAPPGDVFLAAHAHCSGCAVAFAGLVAMGLAAASLLITRSLENAGAVVRR